MLKDLSDYCCMLDLGLAKAPLRVLEEISKLQCCSKLVTCMSHALIFLWHGLLHANTGCFIILTFWLMVKFTINHILISSKHHIQIAGCYWTGCQSKWFGVCAARHFLDSQSDDCDGLCMESKSPPCLPLHTHFYCCKPGPYNGFTTFS
jgi:hypothetical protein